MEHTPQEQSWKRTVEQIVVRGPQIRQELVEVLQAPSINDAVDTLVAMQETGFHHSRHTANGQSAEGAVH